MSVQAISWVLEHSRSTNTARCVLISIANHMGGDGSGWVYVDRICREANCSLNSYHRAVQWAEDNGELERVSHAGGSERVHIRHRPNMFRFPALAERPTHSAGCGTQNGEEGGTQIGDHPGTQNGEVNIGAVSRAVSRANTDGDVERVFAAWVTATGRSASKTRLSADRRKKIEARLKEGFDVDELIEAVQGVTLSDFHMGNNDRRQKYDDLTTVLRDGSQVEKFRDLFRNPPSAAHGPKAFDVIRGVVEGGFRELG